MQDLNEAGEYIVQDNPSTTAEMGRRAQEAAEYLKSHPALGRSGRVRDTRELVVFGTPFLIVYRVRFDTVQVLRGLHHARKWP